MILQGPEVQLLKDLGQQIRLIDKKIRKIKRDRAAALSRPGSPTKDSRPATASAHIDDSTEIDPIIELEEEKGKINARYEQVNEGRGYETLIEHEIQDFMDAYYQEITRAIKDPNWIAKYFDAEAYMHVVNVGSFVGRDLIVKTLVRKFDGLKMTHAITKIQLDMKSSVITGEVGEAYLSANVYIQLTIDNDTPRKCMHIIEWGKSKEMTPFDIVMVKDYFVVQDARPLYHWAEKDKPLTKYEIMKIDLAVQKAKEAERLELLRILKEREEEGEEEEDGEDGEDLEEGSLEESLGGGGSAVLALEDGEAKDGEAAGEGDEGGEAKEEGKDNIEGAEGQSEAKVDGEGEGKDGEALANDASVAEGKDGNQDDNASQSSQQK